MPHAVLTVGVGRLWHTAGGKQHFYEFDARVPMIITGPGIATNSTPSFLAGNVDLVSRPP